MKWITVQGQDREGKGLHYLIHGAHDLEEGDRVLVFPSADRRIPYAASRGLPIEVGSRVVTIPHSKMPWSRITTSIFANDAIPPTANFEADGTRGYQPYTVEFYDISYANPPIFEWLWDFGDGTTSTEQHPVHTYQGLGWFTVTLTVTNGLGEDTMRREAYIYSGVDHPIDLEAWRIGPTSALIDWEPGANNTHVVITRRDDFSPPHPNNGTMIYHGAAGPGSITDSGLQAGKKYYYRIWGIRGGILSEGYRSATAQDHNDSIPGTYYLTEMLSYGVGEGGTESTFPNALGSSSGSYTRMGYLGWFEARFDSKVNFSSGNVQVTVAEITVIPGPPFTVTLDPMQYLNSPNTDLVGVPGEIYEVQFSLPNVVRIKMLGGRGYSGNSAYGNICWVRAVVS